jgi:hypothetical protein
MSAVTASRGLTVQNGDVIRVEAWSNLAVTLRGAILFRPTGWPARRPVPIFTADFAVGSARALAEASIRILEDGFIEDLTVLNVAAAATQRGQTYCIVSMQRSGVTMAVLASDYIWSDYSLSMGAHVPAGPAGGAGFITTQSGGNPAAGNEMALLAVPTGAIWRLHTIAVSLVQGATQTPTPSLRTRDSSGNIKNRTPITTTAIAVSSTSQLTWGIGLVQESAVGTVGDEVHTAPLPIQDLIAADDIATVTTGIGANTDYGLFTLHIEEWVMPNP